MSFRPATVRIARASLNAEACVVCRCRVTKPARRYASFRPYPNSRAVQERRMPAETRVDVDKRNRNAYLLMFRKDGLLALDPYEADQLISDFQAADAKKIDLASNIQQRAKKYKVTVGDIAMLAIPLLRIPDVKDPNARLPSSGNPMVASRLLLACCAAKDPSATLQILAAVYHRDNESIPQATDIARLFSASEIQSCMKMMEQLAQEGNAEAMTLHGQFLERAGQTDTAKDWYERAVKNADTKFNPKYPHPMSLPRESPWVLLANRLLPENTPEARAKAKAGLEKGALQAGDPLAYYELAFFEDAQSPEWLRYMSKAAASGHLEATYRLGQYYMDVNADPSSYLIDSRLKKAIQFVTNWRRGSVHALAKEWFMAAAAGGHKPAMHELAQISSSEGDRVGATAWLRRITEPPTNGKREEWPRLVEQARRRLAGTEAAGAKFS